ncbi:hypothetical protein BH11PAT1_BH11PAT1_5690 [soil metagenome]
MHIQDIFYLLGSILMVLGIVLLLGVVVLLFYIKKKVTDIHTNIETKIDQVSRIASHSGQFASDIGATLAEGAIRGVKRMTSKKRT